MGKELVVWPPKESIRKHLPEIFLEFGYWKCRVIIDCAEVFNEKQKLLSAQTTTWSDYRHRKMFKFLFGIVPTGFISFLSSCYGGRASEKLITKDSGFYDLLGRNDEVMAGMGFQIQEDLLLHFFRLVFPPGARVKIQITKFEVEKIKEVANLRIYVERAINRIINYSIF